MAIFNSEVMREPVNWITVFLMCGFGVILLALLFPDHVPSSS